MAQDILHKTKQSVYQHRNAIKFYQGLRESMVLQMRKKEGEIGRLVGYTKDEELEKRKVGEFKLQELRSEFEVSNIKPTRPISIPVMYNPNTTPMVLQ